MCVYSYSIQDTSAGKAALRKRARSNTVTLMEEKMGLSENKSLRFKADLAEAWRTVADKYGNDSLACEELREVLSLFGYLPQISEEALPLLVQHLDTDGDDRIAFDDFMNGIKGWLEQEDSDDGSGADDGVVEGGTDEDGGNQTAREDSIEAEREDSVEREREHERDDEEDKGQLGQFVHFFTHFDRDGDGRLEEDELHELLDFLKAGKHTDTDGEHHGQAHTEVIKVLSHQLLQAASHSDDGHITIDDFLNTLRNISIALQDFSLNLPRQLAQPIADAKSLESVPLAKGDKEELARLRFDNTALLARQEQLERSLQQIGALNEKLAKEKLAQKEELDAAAKKIKNLQQHRDKAKELSDQVESYKEELTRFRKAEAELTKLNAKLKAEVEALAGNRDEDQRTRSEMEEMEYTIGVQKEALADLEKSLEEKERTLATVQEQNGQLVAALKKAAQEAKDLGDAKSDLDIELSKHQLQLSTAQSEVATLREKVNKLEAERKLIAGTAAAVAARPPSLQAELEALRSKEKVAGEEERRSREAEEREQKQRVEREWEEREKQLLQSHQQEVEARRALETQMRREQEEREQRERESDRERARERATLQQALGEKEAQVLQLTEELKRREQERLDREMKWLLEQQEATAKLKELTDQAATRDDGAENEIQALRGVIENAKRERQKLRLRNKELDDELKRLVQELRQAEDRYARLRLRAQAGGGFFASLFSCCLPVQSNLPLHHDGIALPETTGESADQELRVMTRTTSNSISSNKRRPVVMSPKRPLIQGGEDYDDDDDELEPAVHGAGVGLGRRSLLSRVEDSSSSGSGVSSGAVTPDTSEAEKESEGKSEGESERDWPRVLV